MSVTASKDVHVPLESTMAIKGWPVAAGDSVAIRRGETIAVAVDELSHRCPVGAGQFRDGSPSTLDVSRADKQAHLSFGLRHACTGAFLARKNAKRPSKVRCAGSPISSWRAIRFRRRWSCSAGCRACRSACDDRKQFSYGTSVIPPAA